MKFLKLLNGIIYFFCFVFFLFSFQNSKFGVFSFSDQKISTPFTQKIFSQNYENKFFSLGSQLNIKTIGCIKNLIIDGKKKSTPVCGQNYSQYIDFGFHSLKLSLQTTNPQNPNIGINNFQINKDFLNIFAILLIFVFLFNIFYTKNIFFVFVLFFVTRIFLINNIGIGTYSRDSDGHMEYINDLAKNIFLPAPLSWQTHQMPLYYYMAAALKNISDNFGLNSNYNLQILSIFLSLGTLFFFYKILKFFELKKETIILLLILSISLWGISINSIKIGNDPASYFGFMLFFWVLLLWREKKYSYNFLICVIFSMLLAIYFKKTNMSVLPIFGIFTLFGFFEKKFGVKKLLNISFCSIFGVIIGLMPWIFHLQKYNINFLDATPPSVKVADRLRVENNSTHYFFPRLVDMFYIPYTSTASDILGRNNFWQFLIKTGFFGEFQYAGYENIQRLILIIGCLIGFFVLIYFFRYKGKYKKDFWFLMICNIIWIFSLLYFFFGHPYACNQDFRYILPSYFLGSIIFGFLIQEKKLQNFVWCYIILNFIFMISLIS